jgi:hypothetical protein
MELMSALIAGTREGKVKWASLTSTGFMYARPEGAAMISSRDADGKSPFVFALYDADGAEIDKLESEWGDQIGPEEWEAMPWNGLLSELDELARADALNIDRVVDALLRAAETGAPPSHAPDIKTPADEDIPF